MSLLPVPLLRITLPLLLSMARIVPPRCAVGVLSLSMAVIDMSGVLPLLPSMTTSRACMSTWRSVRLCLASSVVLFRVVLSPVLVALLGCVRVTLRTSRVSPRVCLFLLLLISVGIFPCSSSSVLVSGSTFPLLPYWLLYPEVLFYLTSVGLLVIEYSAVEIPLGVPGDYVASGWRMVCANLGGLYANIQRISCAFV